MTSVIPFCRAAPLFNGATQRLLNAFQQLPRFDGLRKKIDSPGLYHLSAHGNVAVAAYEDELLFAAPLNELLLKIDAVHSRHLYIHNDTGWSGMRWTG